MLYNGTVTAAKVSGFPPFPYNKQKEKNKNLL